MRHEIILAQEAVDDLGQLKANVRARVRDAIETHLRHEPRKQSKSRIKRLRGLRKPQFRLRIDEVQVFYDVVDQQVRVLAVVAKRDAADWLSRLGEAQ